MGALATGRAAVAARSPGSADGQWPVASGSRAHTWPGGDLVGQSGQTDRLGLVGGHGQRGGDGGAEPVGQVLQHAVVGQQRGRALRPAAWVVLGR